MSVSEAGGGVMTSREAHFSVAGVQNSPANVPVTTPVVQNMHMGYRDDNTAVFAPPPYQSGEGSAGGGSVMLQNLNNNSSEPMKRKRGRPRKYGPDGSMTLGLNPAASPPVGGGPGGSLSPQDPVNSGAAQTLSAGPASPNSLKKARGRPPGSSKKQQIDNLGKFLNGY